MKYINPHKCLLALALLCAASSLFAQTPTQDLEEKAVALRVADTNISTVHMSEERETPHMILFDQAAKNAYKLADAPRLMEQKLGLRKNVDELKFYKDIPLKKMGLVTQRYKQYYKGVKVEHGDYIATGKNEQLVAINGEYYELEDINTTPSITEKVALQQAIDWVGADSYAHDFILESYNGVYAPDVMDSWHTAYQEYYPTGELVIVDDYNTKTLDHDLAWKFNIYALHPRSRGEIYVNAHTGKIMLNDPIIKHWQAAATGELGQAQVRTRYSGVQTIQTTKLDVLNEPNPLFDVTGGLPALSDSRSRPVNTPYLLTGGADAWVLIDQTREAVGSDLNRVETYDVNGLGGAPLSVPIYGQARSFTDPDNVWDNMLGAASAEHVRGIQSRTNPAERQYDDDIAWDAHWGAGVVHDYWMDRHSRESYDGEGAPIRSYVHIGNAFDNAFWNGSVMSYGDGQTFKSLTSLDVCGHEVGHAVCSSTSDLVYARQSGGMNEGFSDIWAATTEYYQIEKTPSLAYDPITNPAGYRPFGIGEQIDPTGDNATTDRSVGALRWMDAPKTEGDPDTFGGERWTETENCEPTLANDQCGVHSNSGVLNKWFYLMTVGSGANPNSPDSQYAGTNANVDDSVNDNGDTYSVNGLGFKIAEQIAFGAEVLLTPNGTFAECRLASVVIARNMSNQIITTENGTFNFTGGICGNIEEDVVNAWFGVGVGDVFDCSGLDALQAGFLGVDKAVVESATADECDAVSIIQVEYFLNSEAAIAQTITVDAASTAIEGKDFIIDQKVFTNTTGGYVAQSFDIKIINDALVEEPETIVLKFAANSSSDFDTRTITINDDDVIPTIGIGTATLLDEKFENGLPDGWSTDNKVIDGPQRWYVGIVAPSSTQPANATGMAYVGQAQGSDTYQGTQGNNDIYLVSKQIDGRGFENITVQFDWGAGGERDAGINAEPFDYGEFTYSFDGIEFISTSEIFAGDGSVSPLTPVQGTYNELLSFLDGKQFFLGWRWFNDPLVGDGPSFSVDNVLVTGVPAQIESELGHGKIARVDAGTEVFFLSNEDGGVIASINNAASDLGCVDASITSEGNSLFDYGDGRVYSTKIITATNASNAQYTISLYYTASEVSGFTNAPTDLKIIKADNIATKTNVVIDDNTMREVITDPSDNTNVIGYKYTSTFTGFSEFALMGEGTADALAVELTRLTATAQQTNIQLDWTTENELDNRGFQVERQAKGEVTWTNIGFVATKGNSVTGHRYTFVDETAEAGVTYLYRLVQLDNNNAKTISNVVSAVISTRGTSVDITPNPAVDHVLVSIGGATAQTATVSLLSISGQVLAVDTNANTTSTTRVDLSNYPSGIYFIKVATTQGTTVEKVVKR